jgi:hypothetical protein
LTLAIHIVWRVPNASTRRRIADQGRWRDGNDRLVELHAIDASFSGGGNDVLTGSDGDDTLNGDSGKDQLLAASATIFWLGGSENDVLPRRGPTTSNRRRRRRYDQVDYPAPDQGVTLIATPILDVDSITAPRAGDVVRGGRILHCPGVQRYLYVNAEQSNIDVAHTTTSWSAVMKVICSLAAVGADAEAAHENE